MIPPARGKRKYLVMVTWFFRKCPWFIWNVIPFPHYDMITWDVTRDAGCGFWNCIMSEKILSVRCWCGYCLNTRERTSISLWWNWGRYVRALRRGSGDWRSPFHWRNFYWNRRFRRWTRRISIAWHRFHTDLFVTYWCAAFRWSSIRGSVRRQLNTWFTSWQFWFPGLFLSVLT